MTLGTKKIRIPIYDADVYICPTEEDYEKLCKKLCIPQEYWEVEGVGKCITGDFGSIICLTERRSLATLVHECVHCGNFILEKRGVVSTTSEDEALAYLVGYIWEQINKKTGLGW
jgi:hypothetical protein